MPRLLRIIEGFWETTQRYRQIYGLLPTSMEISVLEHRLLLNHIKSRNPDDAARILITHIRRTRLTLAEHLHEMRDQWNGNGSSAGWVDVAAPAP
jgi:DNA-binding GntR family transcriptional regulator